MTELKDWAVYIPIRKRDWRWMWLRTKIVGYRKYTSKGERALLTPGEYLMAVKW